MKPHGMSGHKSGILLFLLMALAALLIIPGSVQGATPPLLPHLTVSVSNETLSQEEDLGVSAVWIRDASAYRPPESLDLRLYAIPSGSFVARYTIPADGDMASDDDTRRFSGMVASSELPAGRLLLVAIDPVSGTDDRVVINVTEPGPDFPGVQVQRYLDTLFSWIAAVLLVVLGAGLGLLVKRP